MKKFRILFLLLFFCAASIRLSAQDYPTQNENFIFWQPNAKIDFSDFQGIIDTTAIRLNHKYDLQLISSTGIKSVIDIPKNRQQRKVKPKRIYFAPVFCKKCSSIFSEDSTELKREQLYFDIAECCARKARMDVEAVYKEQTSGDSLTLRLLLIRDKWIDFMYATFASYSRETIEEKQDNAYERWATTTAEFLEETQNYATKPEDCFRLMIQKPIEKGYFSVDNVSIKFYSNRIKVEYK